MSCPCVASGTALEMPRGCVVIDFNDLRCGHGHARHGLGHGHGYRGHCNAGKRDAHESGGHDQGDNENDEVVQPEHWVRRKDLRGDLGARRRLRASAEKSSRKFVLMLLLSASFFLAELVVGVWSGSLAVLADAFHMLTDVAALVCGYYVARLSLRPQTSSMSFGWKRAEIVGALCNACFLIAICVTIALEAFEKLAGLKSTDSAELLAHADKIMTLGCVGLAINLGGMCIFGGHGHSHGGGGHSHGSAHLHAQHQPPGDDTGNPEHNFNEWSMYLHVLGDAIGSAFVILNACILKFGIHWGDARLLADPIASLLMCFIILVQAVPLVRATSLILMESAPAGFRGAEGVNMNSLREDLENLPGVIGAHQLCVWQLDSSTVLCTVHIVLQADSVQLANHTVDRIKKLLHRNNIHSSTVQTEIHHPQCSLCDDECTISLSKQSQCSDFVCDDAECIANSISIPGTDVARTKQSLRSKARKLVERARIPSAGPTYSVVTMQELTVDVN